MPTKTSRKITTYLTQSYLKKRVQDKNIKRKESTKTKKIKKEIILQRDAALLTQTYILFSILDV